MVIKALSQVDVKNKLVLLRVDINAPLANKKILDCPRFKESAKTISFLLNKKAKVVIIAHQGRKGDKDFTPLNQHAKILSKHLKISIGYVNSLFERTAVEAIKNLKPGKAILLKNVRDYPDETSLKKDMYKEFCKNFDLYVNDAFSVCHRAQASIILPPKYLKSYTGLSLQKELDAISHFHFSKNKRNIFILGGAKIQDYLPILNVLKNKNSHIIAAGVLGDLILTGLKHNLGYEQEWLKTQGYTKLLPQLMKIYNRHKKQITLPIDFAFKIKGRKEIKLENLPVNKKIMDIGEGSIKLFKNKLINSNVIFMKGPMGFSEYKDFSKGTVEILKEISKMTKSKKTFSLLGGGHLTTSIQKYKIPNNFSYISLSGGALIKSIPGEKLPGIEALIKSK